MRELVMVLGVGLPLALGCSGSCMGTGDAPVVERGMVSVDGQFFQLEGAELSQGEGWFELTAAEVGVVGDCYVPTSGVYLYGELPGEGITSLSKQRVALEFTGDNNDAQVGLCALEAFFAARGDAWVQFGQVSETTFTASFGGSFDRYANNSGQPAALPAAVAGKVSGSVKAY